MKTTTNRVHRNGATKTNTKQAEKAEPGINDGTYTGNCPISLTVFDHDRDTALAGCDLTAKDWADLVALAKSYETSVGALLKKNNRKGGGGDGRNGYFSRMGIGIGNEPE